MDLPLKPKTIDVAIDDGEIVFHLRPLDDFQLLELYGMSDLLETGTRDGDGDDPAPVEIREAAKQLNPAELIKSGQLHELFIENYRGATCADGEPLTVGGEPFDPENEEHFLSLKFVWRITIAAQLMQSGVTISDELLGNSRGPESPSPRDTAPSVPSATANAG
jgi:hypothetical protein